MFSYQIRVVGLPYHSFMDVRDDLAQGVELVLERQPHNEHDSNAVAVFLKKSVMIFFSEKVQIGFITSEQASKLAPVMDQGKKFFGRISEFYRGDFSRDRDPKIKIMVHSY